MGLDGVPAIVEADAEQEIRFRNVGSGIAQPTEHVVGSGRPEQVVACPEPIERRASTVGERLSRRVAGGDHGVVKRRITPLPLRAASTWKAGAAADAEQEIRLAIEDRFDLGRRPGRRGALERNTTRLPASRSRRTHAIASGYAGPP